MSRTAEVIGLGGECTMKDAPFYSLSPCGNPFEHIGHPSTLPNTQTNNLPFLYIEFFFLSSKGSPDLKGSGEEAGRVLTL